MSQPPDRTRTTPRWTTLALLGAAVLGLHLSLLVGDLSNLAASPLSITPAAPTLATPEPIRAEDATPPTQLAQPPRAPISTVRWIVEAKPAPLPAPKPLARATPPKPPKPPKPSTPVQAIEPSPTPQPTDNAEWVAPTDTDGEPASALHEGSGVGTAGDTAHVVALAAPTERPSVETAASTETPSPVLGTVVSMSPPQASAANAFSASEPPPTPTQPPHSETRPPAQPPASTQLAYGVTGSIKGLNYSASGTLDWKHADGHYNARMEIRVLLLGSRVQTSTGRVDGSGLLPERFSDKSRSERAAHFDHAQNTIRFSNNQPDARLQPGAQDRLSLFMQLAGLLQAQPSAYPVGRVISLQVAGTSDAEVWRFRVAEEETLALPAGNLRTRHLVREPREPRDSRIDIWFAPDLAHLPVRIRITQESGDRVDQQLSHMP